MSNNLQVYHKALKQFCQWFPQERITRMRNLALLVMGLQLSRSVHMSLIVRKWPLASKEPSLVNRLRRFLENRRVMVRELYHPIAVELVGAFAGQRIRLVIDCTKVGFNFRLMTVSIAYKRRTLPLVWSVHRGRKGHTKAEQQVALLEYVRQLLPEHSDVWVVGDTGFQAVPLLRWLRRQGWHFVIRQQGRIKVRPTGYDWIKLNQIPLQPGETRYLGWVQLTEKHGARHFWLILHWDKGEDEPWFLVSDQAGQRRLIRVYQVRMWTEEMYGDMKGHGFDLEATHLDNPNRISRLVLGVCIAFVWFITLGSWIFKRGFRHFVDHKSRRDKSYFRIGWDWIERCIRLQLPVPIRFKPCF
jgi:hypothetical protein